MVFGSFFGGFWWFLDVFLVVFDGFGIFRLVFGFLMVFGFFWWFLVVFVFFFGGFCRVLVRVLVGRWF